FDGSASFPIGANRIDKYFWSTVSTANLWLVVGTVDPVNRCIIWIYSSAAAGSGVQDKALIYNWEIDRWSQGDISAEWIGRGASFGYNLDTLDNTGFNLDTLPYSLDSRVWAGGNPLLGGFDSSHKLGFFNGSPLAATVDTSEAQPLPGRRATMLRAWPLVDGSSPTVAPITRNRLIDSQTVGSAVAINNTGFCPLRAEGRYHALRIATAANDTTWSHIEGVQVEFSPGGGR
ncbi:MAG: hypothetical protein KGL35_19360, partial [Bradyrhizobium sp.]|nr:hypothetical protein [Bradyrhizobium sp.]